MALTQWQLKPVETDSIASGDFLAFADESETGDPINKITIDNLATFLAGGANLSASAGVLTATATALDDVATGDAASTLATSTGNITIDAQGNDTDIIFKGTDNTSDITMLTLAGADAGKATFNGDVSVGTSLQTATIDFTDGDLAMTIADGGGVTFAQASTFTGGLTLNGDANLAAEKLIKIGGTAEAHDFSTEHSGHGITLTMEAGETLTLGQAVYVDANGKAQHPDVDASGVTGKPAIGIAMTGASSGTSVNVMVLGIFRDTTYNFSPGAAVIMTGTDGALTTTAGDTAADGDIVQRVGIAITADMLFVMPSIDEIEHA